MKSNLFLALVGLSVLLTSVQSQAEAPPVVGREAAGKYFQKRQKPANKNNRKVANTGSSGSRYLALHVGTFIDDQTYKWGSGREKETGQLTAGVTYRVGEWVNSMDLLFRADFISYDVDGESPLKMSLLPIIAFPDSKSEFPLYFGAGLGLGIFFRQANDESALSLDYQILAGARLMNLVESMGFMVEVAMKNSVFLLSDGQHNGVSLNAGAVFNF